LLSIGNIAGPSKIIEAVNELQQYILFCPSSIAQYAALKAFDISITKIVQEHRKRHDIARRLFSKKFEIQGGQGAFYFFLKAPNGDGKKFVQEAVKKNVLLLPGNIFSERNTHFRLSYATSIKDLKKGITILNELAEKY